MIRWCAPLLLVITLGPAAAQETPEPAPQEEEGFSLMQRGAELLLRGLMEDVEPHLREMEQGLKEMEPALREMLALIDDLRNYEMPEKLPNGDIIMRRKPDLPAPPKSGEIDL